MAIDWRHGNFDSLWNVKENENNPEKMTTQQLQNQLLIQSAALQLMGEKIQRIEDTCRYLMEYHYLNVGKD